MSNFSYSFDKYAELPVGEFATEKDAYDAASFEGESMGEKKPFFIILTHPADVKWNIVAEDIIEQIAQNFAKQNELEFWPDKIASEKDIAELDRDLANCITSWVKRHKINAGGTEIISWTKRFIWNDEAGEYIQDLDFDDSDISLGY